VYVSTLYNTSGQWHCKLDIEHLELLLGTGHGSYIEWDMRLWTGDIIHIGHRIHMGYDTHETSVSY